MRRLLVPGLVLTSLATGACNAILGIDETPTVTGSTSAVDAGDMWACLDLPNESTLSSASVALTFKVSDALTPETTAGPSGGSDFTVLAFTPLPGISVAPCLAIDIACATPEGATVVTGDAGIAALSVPQDFHGYFELSGAGYLTSRLYIDQLADTAAALSAPANVIASSEAQLIGDSLGVPVQTAPDSGVGQAIFQIYDCFDRRAANVVFTLSGDAGGITPFYYFDSFPNRSATQTDSNGVGGAVNVPAGPWTVTATLVGSGRVLRSRSIYVASGGVTTAWFRTSTH